MDNEHKPIDFHDFNLDDRILKGITSLGWQKPTLVQETAIPLILEGRDVLIRARTGAGKTGAFAIPIVQKLFNKKLTSAEQQTRIVILAPSGTLCNQIYVSFKELITNTNEIKCVDLEPNVDIESQKPVLLYKPDIVISTPSRLLQHLEQNNLDLKENMEVFVIDEADLVYSCGYKEDLECIFKYFPKIYQSIFASATLSRDINQMKKAVMLNPVVLKLEEPDMAPPTQMNHYYYFGELADKMTALCALFSLKLVRGKTIVFANSVSSCYRIKMCLDKFGIATSLVNCELPLNIRCRSINQFNEGEFDILIASEKEDIVKKEEKDANRKDKECGVSRGIDFHFVSNIINFEFPRNVDAYIHQAGRTARGNNQGNVLSFVSQNEMKTFTAVKHYLSNEFTQECVIKPYQFNLDEVQGFKYRVEDYLSAASKGNIKRLRIKEIKREMLNSEKLKMYLTKNPAELKALGPVKVTQVKKIRSLKIPEYNIPVSLRKVITTTMVTKTRKKSNDIKNGKVKKKKGRSNVLKSS